MRNIDTYIKEGLVGSTREEALDRMRREVPLSWLMDTVKLSYEKASGLEEEALRGFFESILIEDGDGWILDFDLVPNLAGFKKKYPTLKRYVITVNGFYMGFHMESLPPENLRLKMTDKCQIGFDIKVEIGRKIAMNPATCRRLTRFLNGASVSILDASLAKGSAGVVDGLDIVSGRWGITLVLQGGEGEAEIKNLVIRRGISQQGVPKIQIVKGTIDSTRNVRVDLQGGFMYVLHFVNKDAYKIAYECIWDQNEVKLPDMGSLAEMGWEDIFAGEGCKIHEGGRLYKMLEGAISDSTKGTSAKLRISNPGPGGAYSGWIIFYRDKKGTWAYGDGDLREP